MISTVRDRITLEFIQLSLKENLATARNALKKKAGLLGIVLDEENQPVTIVVHADLDGEKEGLSEKPLTEILSQLPPGIVIPIDMTLEAFVSSSVFTALDDGAHGAIVTDQDKVIGILTEEEIDSYLLQEYEGSTQNRGYSSQFGQSTFTGTVIVLCDEFLHRNELRYYSRHKPPNCKVEQPYIHPLKRRS